MKLDRRIFLGGTCNNSTWRNDLIKLIEEKMEYFNPVVDNWTEECFKKEMREKEKCDYLLFTITPLMTGVYSIAEVVDYSNKKPEKVLFCVLEKGGDKEFDKGQMKSLEKVKEMINENGGKSFDNLYDVARYLIR